MLIDLINNVPSDSRRSMENSLLAAVGLAIVGLVGFISQVASSVKQLAASSVPTLWYLTVLFFILLLAKVMNMTLDALFDNRRRTYGVAVFLTWATTLIASAVGLALVAYQWLSILTAWSTQG